jgi:cyanophycinase
MMQCRVRRGFAGRGCFGAVLAGFCWFAAIAAAPLAADDNLLGLPESLDANRPGAVMLHGGGLITDDAFNEFIELAGGREAKVVFVPSAGYQVGSYGNEEEFLDAVSTKYSAWSTLPEQGKIREFQFLYTDDPEDADDPQFTAPLEEATGVWFSGGFQGRLNHSFVGEYPKLTRFQELLRKVVEKGGIVGGSSAGMAALPQIMTLSEDRPVITAPAKAVAAHGMGLLTNAIVEQHFDARGGRFERFFKLLRDTERLDSLAGRPGASEEMVGLAVEEHTAVVAQNDRLSVLGKGKAHVFLKNEAGRSISWNEMAPGETARLKRDVPKSQREELVLVQERKAVASNTTASSE